MTDKLRELNETYYELYGRLYENGEQLTKEQRDSIAAKLLAEYESEYEVLRLKAEIARARELYELRLKSAELIPRTWRVLHIFRRKYNRAAIQSGAEVAAEVERYFAGREAALYAAEEAAEQAQEDSTAGAEETAQEPRETAEQGTEQAQEAPAGGSAAGAEETAEQDKDAAQGAGEADLSEKTVGAGAETDGGECERFTAAPTADGDDNVPTGESGATKE